MFLKNKYIIFKIKRSKVTDYAALTVLLECETEKWNRQCERGQLVLHMEIRCGLLRVRTGLKST